MGKIAPRSSGPAGSPVAGDSGGGPGGRSASRLTQWVGIASSARVNFTVWAAMTRNLTADRGVRWEPGVARPTSNPKAGPSSAPAGSARIELVEQRPPPLDRGLERPLREEVCVRSFPEPPQPLRI